MFAKWTKEYTLGKVTTCTQQDRDHQMLRINHLGLKGRQHWTQFYEVLNLNRFDHLLLYQTPIQTKPAREKNYADDLQPSLQLTMIFYHLRNYTVSWPFVQLRIRSQVWKDQSVSNQSWKVGKNSIGVKVPEKSWNFFDSNWTGGDFKDGKKLDFKLMFNQSSNYSFDQWSCERFVQ